MALHLVPEVDYRGENGIAHLNALRFELAAALRARDWSRLRRLDYSCAQVVDKVIDANRDHNESLIVALKDLKNVYAHLIEGCHSEAAALAL